MCSLHWQKRTYYSIRTMSERLKSLWIAVFETTDFNTLSNESQQIRHETTYESWLTSFTMWRWKYRNFMLTTLTSQNLSRQYSVSVTKRPLYLHEDFVNLIQHCLLQWRCSWMSQQWWHSQMSLISSLQHDITTESYNSYIACLKKHYRSHMHETNVEEKKTISLLFNQLLSHTLLHCLMRSLTLSSQCTAAHRVQCTLSDSEIDEHWECEECEQCFSARQ